MNWDVVAGLGAIAAALVVMWQSWETRKAAQASRDAVRVAAEALSLARTEEGNTRKLLSEAVRSRIDAGMPQITLTPVRSPIGATEMTAVPLSDARQPIPSDMVFRLPKGAANYICLLFEVTIANDSDRHVTLVPNRMRRGHGLDERPLPFGPKETKTVGFEIWRSVQDWVDGTGRSDFGGTSWWSGFSVIYEDTKDTSATDVWTIDVVGSPLVPVDDETAGYRVDTQGVVLGPVQHQRTYYLSRSADEQLQ